MDPIDPFDKIEPKKDFRDHVKSGINYFNNTLFNSFIKFILLIFLVCILALFFHLLYSDNGTVIKPLVIGGFSNDKNLREEPITALLRSDLQRIRNVYDKNFEKGSLMRPNLTQIKLPSGYKPFFRDPSIPTISPVSLQIDSIDYRISQLGDIGANGISLSLGQMILSFKDLIHRQGRTIAVNLQKYGSDIRLVAVLEDPGSYGRKSETYEVRRTLTNDNSSPEELIPAMIEELSFQIAHDTCERDQQLNNTYPQTWPVFKNLTLGWEAYYNYNIGRNIKDLDTASSMARLAKSSEPYYSGSDELLFNLGLAYFRSRQI